MSSCFSESEDVAFVDPTPPLAGGGGRMGGEAPAGGADDADSEAMAMIAASSGGWKTFRGQRGSPYSTKNKPSLRRFLVEVGS